MFDEAELNDKQRLVLGAIAAFVQDHGYSPSVRDIADRCDMKSPSTVLLYLKQLEARGLIRRTSHRGRTSRLAVRQDAVSPAQAESRTTGD